jgi:hypothetical protein
MAKRTIKQSEIKAEDDTARAAHLRRVVAGTKPLEPLTAKDDSKRKARQKMIDDLPRLKPVIPESAGAAKPTSNDAAILRDRVAELEAELEELTAPKVGA